MKRLRGLMGVGLIFGFLAMVPLGCSDSNSSSPVPPDIPTNRIYVMTIGSGVLSPAIESTSGMTELDAEPVREYILTLDNVTENAMWYTNRPERKAGTTTLKEYIDLWSDIYGPMPPNAVLDGFVTEPDHDGFYLNLRGPVYDSGNDSLVFEVTLLGSTMDEPYPVEPVDIFDIRITVFDNTPEGQINYWSFGQTAQESKLEATGTEGLYKLSLIGANAEVFQLQNAPGTRYEILNQATLEYNWLTYFESDPPNASLTGVSTANAGELKLALLEIDNPSHDGTNVYYDARVLAGNNLQGDLLINMALLIDAPDGTYPLCKQSGNESKCYGHCFPKTTPLCCPDPPEKEIPDCHESGSTAWCDATACKSCTDVCTTYQAPCGKLTDLVIQNDTENDVTVYLQAGADQADAGACPKSWPPLQLDAYPCENIKGDICSWTLKKGDPPTVIKGQTGKCTNATITFEMSPDANDNCGMSIGEFTLNVDPTKDLQEGVDISLVNGNNGKMVVDLGSSWMVQSTSRFVTSIENYEGTGDKNQDLDGVYNYLCDACNKSLKPPACTGPGGACSTQATCNLLRDGSMQGGTVTFTWKGTNW